jgi:predicted dehydrogenase
MSLRLRRRDFLRGVAAGTAAGAVGGFDLGRALAAQRSPNEKLNIGIIGVANRAAANLEGVQGENIVALCDIDDRYLDAAAGRFLKAEKYNDFRKLLERKDLDAVVISTADHVHAPATVAALKLGKHVYVEKPMSHSVYEARIIAETAAKAKVATQMGTQIHATNNYRRVVEAIQAGSIGPVKACHVWVGKTWSEGSRPRETPPVPKYIHWDLWVGPAPIRPYHSTYLPANWRRWWDFGCGTLGDMACHFMDLPFWALKLRHPTSVEAQGPPVHPETTPRWMIVKYEFPARDAMPPVELTWYDGGKKPPLLKEAGLPDWESGVLFVGEKGMMMADYDQYRLYPEEKFKDFTPPAPSIANSIGHYAEWINACKNGGPTTCNFDYSGALTESVLLGNVAYRTGKRLDWDAKALHATNTSDADQYLRREYRAGWTL